MSNQQIKKKSLINIEFEVVEPWVYAGALGSGCALWAIPSGGPVLSWACLGAGFSFFWYWGNNNLTGNRPKKAKGFAGRKHVTVNSAKSSRRIRLDYQAGYVSRETPKEMLTRLVFGKPKVSPEKIVIDKPSWLDEDVFMSPDGTELLLSDVARFLLYAWRYRFKGRGLSHRHWVINFNKRPQWYKNLGTSWFYAFLGLLAEAEKITDHQLVTSVGHQQQALKFEPHKIIEALKWAEAHKRAGTHKNNEGA